MRSVNRVPRPERARRGAHPLLAPLLALVCVGCSSGPGAGKGTSAELEAESAAEAAAEAAAHIPTSTGSGTATRVGAPAASAPSVRPTFATPPEPSPVATAEVVAQGTAAGEASGSRFGGEQDAPVEVSDKSGALAAIGIGGTLPASNPRGLKQAKPGDAAPMPVQSDRNRAKQDKAKQEKAKQEKAKQEKAKQVEAKQVEAKQVESVVALQAKAPAGFEASVNQVHAEMAKELDELKPAVEELVALKKVSKPKTRPAAARELTLQSQTDAEATGEENFDGRHGVKKRRVRDELFNEKDVRDDANDPTTSATKTNRAGGDHWDDAGEFDVGVVDADVLVPAATFRDDASRHAVRRQRRSKRPDSFLPDQFYFENTYLGGDAGYAHALRLLDAAWMEAGAPHRLAALPAQPFDAPEHDGLGLQASVDRTSIDEPGRVFLQVGLRGSERFGWRRPPLELIVVLDTSTLAGQQADMEALVVALLDKLGPQDRIAVLTTGSAEPLADLEGLRHQRAELLPRLEASLAATPAGGDLAAALTRAGWRFAEASQHRSTAPGTQVALVVTRADGGALGEGVVPVVDQLTLGGIVTSVVGLAATPNVDASDLWRIAAAGHGNAHSATLGAPETLAAAVDAELDLLARVVARLARINVRLAPGVKAIRVLGSRPLEAAEVQVVKAREVETDRRLSQVLGIAADRGDDDDGIQTVIPVFYGGDTHVVILELWVEGPGSVADVTLRYKDMVNLDNRASRTSVSLRGVEPRLAGDAGAVTRNRDALEAGERLGLAAEQLRQGRVLEAAQTLRGGDGAAARRYVSLLGRVQQGEMSTGEVAASLELAARRAVGGGG